MKERTYKLLENGKPRVKARLWLRQETIETLLIWQQLHGLPMGRAIDAMHDYCKNREDFRIPRTGVRPSLKSVS